MIVRVDLADKLSSGGSSHDSTQPASGAPDFAASPLRDLMELLHSSEAGLRTSNAAVILKTVGPNRIDTAPTRRLLIAFIERFSDPLVLILLFAVAVSALTGDLPSHRHHRDVDRLSIAKGPRGKRRLLRKLISPVRQCGGQFAVSPDNSLGFGYRRPLLLRRDNM